MNEVLLEALRTRITRVFPEQIRRSVEPLTDEQFWWRPNEATNSAGNLVLHLTGSLNHFLNCNLGGLDFVRDRPAEFAERRMLPKSEVMAAFDAMVAHAETTFDRLTPDRLLAPSPEPKMHTYVFEDLLNIAVHLSNHAGQIVWIAKMFGGGTIDELWMRTHKHGGAWRA